MAHPIDTPGQASAEVVGAAEAEILAMLAAGLTDEAITRQLGVSTRTVRRRVLRLMELLNASSRFQAGIAAAKAGWI